MTNRGVEIEDLFSRRTTLIDLPVLVVEKILRHLSFEELSHLRLTCKHIQRTAERMLNDGFILFGRRVSHASATLKRQLPKKESERRAHPLNRYCDVFSAMETRYTLMTMTYRKFIDQKLCCFIPGKVLDIGFDVMAQVNGHLEARYSSKAVLDVIGILKDIRDYSSMAMEHFDEHVAPRLPSRPLITALRPIFGSNQSFELDVGSPNADTDASRQCAELRREMRNKFEEQNRVIDEQRRMIGEQGKFIRQIVTFLVEMGDQNEWTPRLMNNLHRLSSSYGCITGDQPNGAGDAPSISANAALSTLQHEPDNKNNDVSPPTPKLRRKLAAASKTETDEAVPSAKTSASKPCQDNNTIGRKVLRARRRVQ